MKPLAFLQHGGRVIEASGPFKHVMAITLDPTSGNTRGIARCIVSRDGDVAVKGFVDRSELRLILGDTLEKFSAGERLNIRNETEIISGLTQGDESWDFIGLEDPDIWIDEESGRMHLYFTIPIKHPTLHTAICLGHAEGEDLDALVMTEPVLLAEQFGGKAHGAKEVSIAPLNSQGVRLNLIESGAKQENGYVSTVRIAIAKDMGAPWEYGETVFNPLAENISWIGGHASPGPLLPRSFIDIGENKLVGVMNGREANKEVSGETKYGMFSVGLFIYDYEHGKIEWVSPEPLIQDTEARTITFASQFVETRAGEGILYAHVDDSFVRAYTLYAEGIRALLP